MTPGHRISGEWPEEDRGRQRNAVGICRKIGRKIGREINDWVAWLWQRGEMRKSLLLQSKLISYSDLQARVTGQSRRCPSLLRPTPFSFSSDLTLNSIVDLIQGPVFLEFLQLRSVFLLPVVSLGHPPAVIAPLPLYPMPISDQIQPPFNFPPVLLSCRGSISGDKEQSQISIGSPLLPHEFVNCVNCSTFDSCKILFFRRKNISE